MGQKSVKNVSTLSLRYCQCCLIILQGRMCKKRKGRHRTHWLISSDSVVSGSSGHTSRYDHSFTLKLQLWFNSISWSIKIPQSILILDHQKKKRINKASLSLSFAILTQGCMETTPKKPHGSDWRKCFLLYSNDRRAAAVPTAYPYLM